MSRRPRVSASGAPSATRSPCSAGTPLPARPPTRGSWRRPRRPTRPWAGSSGSCRPPASGGGSGSPGPRSSSRGGDAPWPRATSSTSRRARAPRTATCSAASSCTATGGACRRPTPRTGRSGGATTRARCTCSAGARSSSPSRRAGPRWTSAGSTSPGAHREPLPGEPTYGLYEHKRSFGADLGGDGRRPGARRPRLAVRAPAAPRRARPARSAGGRGVVTEPRCAGASPSSSPPRNRPNLAGSTA